MTSSTLQRRQVIYSGDVQGVGFRYTTRTIARDFDITGFVRNLPARQVELVVEGPEDELEGFLAAVDERMSGHIRSVESAIFPKTIRPNSIRTTTIRTTIDEFASFEIRY